jgi:DDE superfamily endonuclease
LIWDNRSTHLSAAMREWIDAHQDWLTVERLPAYAPELNAAGGRLGAQEEQHGSRSVA